MVQPLIKMNLSEIVLQHNMLILFLQLDFMYNPHIIYAITCNKYKKKNNHSNMAMYYLHVLINLIAFILNLCT